MNKEEVIKLIKNYETLLSKNIESEYTKKFI